MLDNECDIALKKLDFLIANSWQNLTEADTRAKIIDPLFKDVLGWNERDISRESHVNCGFLDYLFCIDKARKFVVEAKKEGEAFHVPASSSGREYSLSGTLMTDNKVKKAIEQVRQYCVDSGAKYAVVSNGNQFIIFEGFKENGDWRAEKCLIFHSPQDVRKNFYYFWNILSRKQVKDGSLRKYISKKSFSFDYLFRPRDRMHAKNATLNRNQMSCFIQPFVEHTFWDMTEESKLDILDKCYVLRNQYSSVGDQINYQFDRIPPFAEKYKTKDILESAKNAGNFQSIYESSERLMMSQNRKGSLILLMGGVGSGKTTFIHHFFNFKLNNPEKTVWFYVDFLETSAKIENIEEHIYRSIIKKFIKKYSNTFEKQIALFKINELKPDFQTILVLVTMIMSEGYSVSLILDNADQHEYLTPKYQENVLSIAKYLTESLKTLTVLALREESFFKSTRSGVLTAFALPPLHISSPRFEDLVRYRLGYVLDLLAKPDSEIGKIVGEEIDLGTEKQIVQAFFEIVKFSFRSSRLQGKHILHFIDKVSCGDMRQALSFFRTFLLSGNTDVAEMLEIEQSATLRNDHYEIPFHHVIKSIILQNSRLYSMDSSPIMNLFEFDPMKSDSHFLNIRVLDFLFNRQSQYSTYGRGFTDIDGIIQESERAGINRMSIDDSLIKMGDYGLIEFENQSKKGFYEANFVKITNTGIYYLKELSHNFKYLDLVWMDTPIADSDVVDELLKHVIEVRPNKTENDLSERYLRTEKFLSYLKKREAEEFELRPEYCDSDLTKKAFMTGIIRGYEDEKAYISSKRKIQASRFK